MIVACNVVLHVSRRGCNFLLRMIRFSYEILLRPITVAATGQLAPNHQKLLSEFPSDVRSAVNHTSLDTKCKIYAVCPNPRCHHLHEAVSIEGSPIPEYPARCKACASRKRTSELLYRRNIAGRTVPLPIKPYVHHDFQDWMGGLLSKPGNERMMDRAWDKSFEPSDQSTPVTSIFEAKILRSFYGPGGKSRFGDCGDDGNYVFSLGVDFFNPFGNKQAGKKRSIGIITLMCLNLPPHLRYRPENIFLAGIIPGPSEPRWHLLNCYLEPLVDDLLILWEPGVWFTRTALYPNGRLVVCAIILVVCDCPAARKVAGFASYTHNYFCHVCYCTRKEHGYSNTNYYKWKRRAHTDVRAEAEQWKSDLDNAVNDPGAPPTDPKASAHGIRWSSLLRLPYFDIVRFVVVDGMHNLFLGIIKDHFRQILGLDHAGQLVRDEETRGRAVDGPRPSVVDIQWSGASYPMLSEKVQKDVRYLRRYLQEPLNEALEDPIEGPKVLKKFESKLLDALKAVCIDLGIDAQPFADQRSKKVTKHAYATALLAWVSLIKSCTMHSAADITFSVVPRSKARSRRYAHQSLVLS